MSNFGSATLSLQGPTGKIRYEIAGERTTVGRTRDNEIVLQDPAVSSHHCEFVVEKVGLVLRDLNSSNGTYVNGRRVQAAPVYDGDAVKIGQFQGRIAVRKPDGNPLKAPGMGGTALIAGAAVALLVVGVGVGLILMKNKKDAERAQFQAYEKKAKEYLALEPCTAAEEAVRKLRPLTPRETPLLGKNGKLSKSEKEKNNELLALSRRREPLLNALVDALGQTIASQKTALQELRAFDDKFQDAEAAAAVKALGAIYADRSGAGEELAEGLKKFQTQVEDFDRLVESLIQKGDRGSAEQLDGYRFKVEPAKLVEECQAKFGKTQQEGLLKLAGVAL